MSYIVHDNGIDRPATADEIADIEAREAQAIIDAQDKAAKAAARQAVLDKLGLTADEAAALFG
jgi:hypothetical protein